MKLSVVMVMFFVLGASAGTYSQQQRVSLDMQNAKIIELFTAIKNQTGLRFVYNVNKLENISDVTVKAENETVEKVLDGVFKDTPYRCKVISDVIVVVEKPQGAAKEAEQAKKITIKGKVTDSEGLPIPGASVFVRGTNSGVATDFDGNFELKIDDKKGQVLVVSFVGMKSKEIKYTGQKTIDVKLESSAESLDEVVVVGYGTTAVKDLTGSVARISEKDLEMKTVPAATSLLQNMAAGVQVSGNTGRPGEVVRVRVRGATSLSGSNNPLYVIDGVPTDDANVLNSIPPSDIASVDVLKDASAAAIYGSRAANGVVIVTTKRGQLNQKAKFSVTYNSSFDTQIKNFTMLNGNEFRAYLKDLAQQTLAVDPGNKTADQILNTQGYIGSADTDWFDEVKQAAWRHNLDMSVRGGSENISYFISGSVLDHKGMVINDDLTRYSLRTNLDINISPKFKIGTNASLTYSDQNKSGTSMHSAQGHRPDLPVYKEDGKTYYDINPVAEAQKTDNTDSYRIYANLHGELELIKGLKLKSSLSVNQYMNYTYNFNPSFLSYYKEATASRSQGRGFTTIFDNTVSLKRTFNDIHSIDFVGGVSFENMESESDYLSKKGYPMDEIYTNVAGGTEFSQASDSKQGRGLFSSFGRLNYKYNDKYLVTVTARYDGSSMFGKNNRYGFFPSGALAWRMNKESFMDGAEFINDLKLKVSAGKTGIQNLRSYSNRDLYEATKYNDQPGIQHSQLGNKDIKWELSTLYDAGIDFAFFNYKVTGSFAYYLKDTEDLIRTFSFPSSMAVDDMYYNVGSVRNQGIEFNINYKVIDTEDIKLDLGLNFATNKNEVRKLETEGAVENSSGTIVQGEGSQVLAVGHAMGSFFGYKYNGIIQSEERIKELDAAAVKKGKEDGSGITSYDGELFPGNLEYSDLNGDGKIDGKDRTIIGNPNPDLFGGFNARFKYKRFSVMANFGFQIGGLKYYGKALQNVPSQLVGLVDYNLYNRWSPSNKDAKIPAIYIGEGVPRLTDLSLYDASYLRLQDFRIAYDLPKVNKLPIQGQVFLSVNNLFTITSYPGTDPATVNATNVGNSDFGGNYETSYPGIRTFSFGLKLNL